jgi:hypothetical protein
VLFIDFHPGSHISGLLIEEQNAILADPNFARLREKVMNAWGDRFYDFDIVGVYPSFVERDGQSLKLLAMKVECPALRMARKDLELNAYPEKFNMHHTLLKQII